jgi:hypothetical protein
MPKPHAELKTRQRAERDGHPENLALRVHRALSWLDRAERSGDDLDARYIFLWIAFNAAYATEIDERYRPTEQGLFQDFIEKLLKLDVLGHISALVWQEFSGSIRMLLDNKFVFKDFWSLQTGVIEQEAFELRFAAAKHAARKALGAQDTGTVLSIALSRLYVLRNQLMHGGATWNSTVNREQLRDGGNLLGKLVPLIIELMMDNPKTLWGDACFPVVKG